MALSAQVEAEVAELDTGDRAAFLADLGLHESARDRFIRAEVVAYEDFIRLGSEAKCREAGKLRLEGKDYVVRDGDIVHFRFAV